MDNKKEILPPTQQEAKLMWAEIIAKIRLDEANKRRKKYKRLSIIAVIIILLTSGLIAYESFIVPDVYTANESNMTIRLADRSTVRLYKGATLTVAKSFPGDTREVTLTGDAVFEVSKSKERPFIVHTGSYDTKVLGTVFKVIQQGKSFHVDLYEGKVQVNKIDTPDQYFELRPKETFSNMGSEKIGAVMPTKKLKDNNRELTATLSFTDSNVKDILDVIQRSYNVKVKYPANNKDLRITLASKDATAAEILERIAIQLNLNIKKNNDNTFELED